MAQTMSTMLTELDLITNRPDLVDESVLAIQAATLKAHRLDFFPRDLASAKLTLLGAAYNHTIALTPTTTRLRSIHSVSRHDEDDATKPIKKYLELIAPDDLLDGYESRRTDIAYRLGTELIIKAELEINYLEITYYTYPDVGTYSSWFADIYQHAILYAAAATIFRLVGSMDESNSYLRMALAEFDMVKAAEVAIDIA